MSLPQTTNVVYITATRQIAANYLGSSHNVGSKLSSKVTGYKGIKFVGRAREDTGVTVKCEEWENVDAHQSNTSEDIKEGGVETIYAAHYSLFTPLEETLASKAKCIEYVVFKLKDSGRFEAFYELWSSALKAVEACPGCCPVVLGQQVEDPTGVVQIQPWMTLEDHIEGFKKRKDHAQIMGPLTEVVTEYVENGWKGFKSYHLQPIEPEVSF